MLIHHLVILQFVFNRYFTVLNNFIYKRKIILQVTHWIDNDLQILHHWWSKMSKIFYNQIYVKLSMVPIDSDFNEQNTIFCLFQILDILGVFLFWKLIIPCYGWQQQYTSTIPFPPLMINETIWANCLFF